MIRNVCITKQPSLSISPPLALKTTRFGAKFQETAPLIWGGEVEALTAYLLF